MKKIIVMITLLMSLVFVSCEKDYVQPINVNPTDVVDSLKINCIIKNDSSMHYLVIDKLKYIEFDSMTIEDNLGNITNWEYFSGEDSMLVIVDLDTSKIAKIDTYVTSNFLGVDGRYYTLKLTTGNKTYQYTKQLLNGSAVFYFEF